MSPKEPANPSAYQAGVDITDVGIPGGMNGRQVADAARVLRTDLRVLLVTGYAGNALLSHNHIRRGLDVLTKPFAIDELARSMDNLLHA